jgi:hypothetical protein
MRKLIGTGAVRITSTDSNEAAHTVGKKTVPMFGCFGKIDLLKNKEIT